MNLGAPAAGAPYWLKYGICSDLADTFFPGKPTDGYGIGIDPVNTPISKSHPCTITLMDSNKRKYQLAVLQAKVPPDAIWPPFRPTAGKNFDRNVVACPARDGYVPPDQWCSFTNQLADPTQSPGIYSISTRAPIQLPRN